MKKAKRLEVFNYVLYILLIFVLSFSLTRAGLIDFMGKNTRIHIGSFHAELKLKWILFFVIYALNGYLHELIHFLTGKFVIPDAKFTMTFGRNLAQTKRIGGDPTRKQDQIFTIMPFVFLSIAAFFIGLAVADITDIPMYFVIFNTAGSIKDIEVFLCMFCFPKDMPVSKIDMNAIDCDNWYRRFWAKWDRFFSK